MGLLKNLFNSKPKNIINEIAETLIDHEKKNSLIRASPLFKDKNISINKEGILSFVVAELLFELETNPQLKSIKLNSEYSQLIEEQKKNVNFQLISRNMNQYFSGEKTLLDLASVYIWSAWKIEEFIGDSENPAMHFVRFKLALRDPILLTTYSMVITQFRDIISKYLMASITKLSDN